MEIWNLIKNYIWRYFALRKINLPYDIAQFEFKLAESTSEYIQAFQILYDSYFELGFTEHNPHKTYIVFQHLLPSTAFLIAKFKGEVVGTVSLVRQNKAGLPLQKVVSLQLKRDIHTQYAEISSLCIKKTFRQSKSGNVFFPLLAFMYQFATKYFDVSDFVIAVYPRHEIYYRGLMGFKRLRSTFEFYGSPAVALSLNLKNANVFFKSKFSKLNPSKNLYYYFTEHQFKEFNFNLPSKNSTQTAPLNVSLLKTFIDLRPSLKEQFMQDHLMILLSSLPSKERHRFIDFIARDLSRQSNRFDVSIMGEIHVGDGRSLQCKVIDIALNGMQIKVEGQDYQFSINHTYVLTLNEPLKGEFNIYTQWVEENCLMGVTISSNLDLIQNFIREIEEEIIYKYSIRSIRKVA